MCIGNKDIEDHALEVMSYNMRHYYEQRYFEAIRDMTVFSQMMIDTGEVMDYVPGRLERLLMKTGWRSRKYKESKARRKERRREYMKKCSNAKPITFRKYEPFEGEHYAQNNQPCKDTSPGEMWADRR